MCCSAKLKPIVESSGRFCQRQTQGWFSGQRRGWNQCGLQIGHVDYFSHHIGVMSSSQLTLTPSFFRGVGRTNHQPVFMYVDGPVDVHEKINLPHRGPNSWWSPPGNLWRFFLVEITATQSLVVTPMFRPRILKRYIKMDVMWYIPGLVNSDSLRTGKIHHAING